MTDMQKEIQTLRKRFAKKVDSLNWQSISYQKKANEQFDEALLSLFEKYGMEFSNNIASDLAKQVPKGLSSEQGLYWKGWLESMMEYNDLMTKGFKQILSSVRKDD